MACAARVYRFGEFVLDVAERQLLRDGKEVPLRPKAFDTLAFLVEREGHLVTRDALLARVWPGTSVSDAVLTHCVAEVRKALDDPPRSPRWVRTLSRAGYRFTAPVSDPGEPAGPSPHPGGPTREATVPAPRTAVAVLPFEDLGPDPGNEALCDGLSEELINGLTKVGTLRVVAHSSSFRFRSQHVDAREIGRLLGVGSIVEGSVRRSGDRLRVSAQLIDASDGCHAWAAQYDRRHEDVFAIQDEIARAVLRELRVELGKGRAGRLRRRRAPDPEAYRLYLEGRWHWHRRFGGSLPKAIAAFERAVGIDPGFAEAHAGLADALSTLGTFAYAPAEAVFPRASSLANRALELDDGLAEAHASRGFVDMLFWWDWASAEAHLTRAADLNPGSALVHLWLGHYLSIVGRLDEAVEEVERAQVLDPLSPIVRANVGWTLYLARRNDRALAELRRVLDLEPGNALASFYAGYAYAEAGRWDEAAAAFSQALSTSGGLPWAAESIGWVHGLRGERERALAALRDAEDRSATGYVPDSAFALLHLGVGDVDRAFAALERAVAPRDALLPWLGRMPCLDPLRPDPRFGVLLRRVGLA